MNAKTKERANLLRESELKATPARLEMLQILEKEKVPVSVEDVLKRFGKNEPDKVTIYRTLSALLDTGIVRQVNVGHRHAHYELDREHHHHAICENCGKIEDIEMKEVEALEVKAAKQLKHFSSLDGHTVEFFGTCNDCKNKERK